jgi:hypothetical protein
MADQIARHTERAPARRLRADVLAAEFFPGEVARLLGLTGVNYAQLREMYRLARVSRGLDEPGRGWSRFTLADLAAVEALVALGGGRAALKVGRRLVLGDIQQTCDALRRLGFDNPLLQVPMAREGRRILARVDGFVLEPSSGQLVLETAWQHVSAFLEARLIENRAIRSAILAERRRISPVKPRRLVVEQEYGTLDGIVAG